MSKVWEVAPHLDAGPDEGPGAFRRPDIHAFSGGTTPPAWGDVAAEVQRWAEIVDTFGTAVRSARVAAQDIPAELARLHCEFERIHPFVDGNGRAGRLLLNLVLEHCRPRPSRSTALLGEQRRLLRRATAGGASGRLEAELSSDGTWRSSQHAVRVYLEGRHRGDPAR